MPLDAVPVERLPDAVDAAIRGVINGLVRAKNAGLVVEMPEKISFQISVIAADGLNALTRTDEVVPQGSRVTVQSGAVDTEVTAVDADTEVTSETVGGRTETESGTETQSASESGNQAFGRSTDTEFTYQD